MDVKSRELPHFLLMVKALLEAQGEDIHSISKRELTKRFHLGHTTMNEVWKEFPKREEEEIEQQQPAYLSLNSAAASPEPSKQAPSALIKINKRVLGVGIKKAVRSDNKLTVFYYWRNIIHAGV